MPNMNLIKILDKIFYSIGVKFCTFLRKIRGEKKPLKQKDGLINEILAFDKEMLHKIGLLLLGENKKYLAILFFEIANYKKCEKSKIFLVHLYRHIGEFRRSFIILRSTNNYFLIGFYYKNGIGRKKNMSRAIYFFKKSFFEEQNSKSALILGAYYFSKKYYRRAVFYFERAAQMGEGGAFNNLGICYLNGIYYKRDYRRAFEFFKLAAEKSFKYSFYDLGRAYEKGTGTKINCQLANKYYEMSEKSGDFRSK